MKRRLVYLLIALFFVCTTGMIMGYFLSYKPPEAKTVIKMKKIKLNIKEYFIAHRKLPDNLEVLKLDKSVYKDAWGRAIIYKIENGEVWLTSYGADGKPNSDDDIVGHWVPTIKHDEGMIITW